MRIGIVGTENSHVDHYIRHFNGEGRYPPHRVTALSGGRDERNTALAQAGGIDDVVDSPADLVGRVDAAIVCSRDGRLHRAQAVPLLAAGLPVLVDKPLACDLEDARAILAAAVAGGVPVTSYSALRWAEPVDDLAATLATGSPPDLLAVSGPADPGSEYGGLFFYGIHVVEIALRLTAGRPLRRVQVSRSNDPYPAVVVTCWAGQTRLLLDLVRPGDAGPVPWRVIAAGPDVHLARTITLGPDYTGPATRVFVRMLANGKAPLAEGQLLAPVELLADVARSVQSAGDQPR